MSTLSRYTRDEFLTPFDRLFDDVFNSFGVTPYAGSYTKHSYPKVDVVEYDDKYVLEADVVIRGGKKTNNENTTKGKYLYKEIKRSSFTRSFSVGEGIDKNKIKADFTNGTIKVDLPKLKIEEQRPRTHKLL
jgi:HSP20 family protein